jgi:hypothetical protein
MMNMGNDGGTVVEGGGGDRVGNVIVDVGFASVLVLEVIQ